jgi:oligopeptide/dipeptide ABC transporter ATP-binding protein
VTAPAYDLAPSTGEAVLEVTDLSVGFPTDDGVVEAVRGVTYSLMPGEVLGIVGESGSGKSVTSLAIMGLLPRTARISGSVKLHGKELVGAPYETMQKLRGKTMAMVFQDPISSLNPVYSIGWQLAEAVRAHQDISKKAAAERAIDLLSTVGIPNAKQRASNYPHEFSGGMRQRVVIAMAIANDPDVLIADEPTTALDVTVQAQILETLDIAREATHAAMVLITHDLGVVAGVADRVLVMYAGKPVETGTVDNIYYESRMPYTLGLLDSVPRLDDRDGGVLRPIPGSPPSLLNLAPGCPFSPRCTYRIPICDQEEPALLDVDHPGHKAACHVSDLLAKAEGAVVPAKAARPRKRIRKESA